MAKTNRIKTAAIPVPQTRDEAEAYLLRIGALQRDVKRIESDMNDELAVIKERFEKLAQPLNDELREKFVALHAWAEANRGDLLKGDSKTAKLATGELAWRTTPPKVGLRNVGGVLEALKKLKLTQFIRTKDEVNKEAILADQESRELASGVAGITITQQEEFIAKPFETDLEVIETVHKQEAA